MRTRESTEATISAVIAIIFDVLAVAAGLWLSMWIRFDSGWDWLPELQLGIQTVDQRRVVGGLATGIFILTFYFCKMYTRPQMGRFEDKVPRIIKAILVSYIIYFAVDSALRIDPGFSRPALAISFFTVSVFVLLERYIIYRIEWNAARHMHKFKKVLILGTDPMAFRMQRAIKGEPFFRAQIVGHLQLNGSEDDAVPETQILGHMTDLKEVVEEHGVNQIILTDISIPHEKMVDLIVFCEQNLISINLVPDIFRILTSGVVVQTLDGIPIIGLSKWPLDRFINRLRKRIFDVTASSLGLIVLAPLIFFFGILVKCSSRGPMFYKQKRIGEDGKNFILYKLRTMNADADKDGPQWTKENDPRRTKLGSFMRANNIDELPQLWNVLWGDMSLVGPRPEQPHYVDEFKEVYNQNRYMVRHASQPGITGWAQVNGLRGDTSISDRVKYDLYYLENWSFSFDFKIILRTLFAHKNAY